MKLRDLVPIEEVDEDSTPQIGELWVTATPELYYDEEGSLNIKIQRRPYLILDDGRGLLIQENNDYHCFKISTKRTQLVKKIKGWAEKGLNQQSYVRIEMPIKIERDQLLHKIDGDDFSPEELSSIYQALFEFINMKTLEKLGNSAKVTE